MHLMNKNSHLFFSAQVLTPHMFSRYSTNRIWSPKRNVETINLISQIHNKNEIIFNVLDKSITWKLGSQRSP